MSSWGNTWDPEKCNNPNDTLYPMYQTAPVGSYPGDVSPYGCYDIGGNVSEWCEDWMKSYPGATYPFDWTGTSRSMRGGRWMDSYVDTIRCVNRGYDIPTEFWNTYGFRMAR